MSKRPGIATPGQAQHMRDMLEQSRVQRGQTRSAFSKDLIGSTRLLEFHQGAPLTAMLLARVLIGYKAEGIHLSRELLLGPAETPPERVPRDVPQKDDSHDVDPLGACVQCLIEAITELTTVSHQLTTAFTAYIQAMQEVTK